MNAWQPEMDGFDAVYSSNLLQWAENPLSVITHWKRCLHATGGHIHAVFFTRFQTLCELRELLPDGLLLCAMAYSRLLGSFVRIGRYEDSFFKS